MNILVTGGAGFIGSHTCVELLKEGYEVTVVDNLSNSKEESLRRVQELAGKSLTFHEVDLLDIDSLDTVFAQGNFEAVFHFAGLKAVGESVIKPLRYYDNNLTGTLNLCALMSNYQVKNLIFSSSATVYGNNNPSPLQENYPCAPINPYGRTKWMNEIILQDFQAANQDYNITLLRYFNPVGAHPSGRIGEDPQGIPNNLLPYVAQVAVGRLPEVGIFGSDYPTPDGTGIRDYIHVVDLAQGHIKALEYMRKGSIGLSIYNLGANHGYSVLEIIAAFERACGKTIPYRLVERRPGDAAISFANAEKANRELKWRVERGIDEICADMWRWQLNNPNGYD